MQYPYHTQAIQVPFGFHSLGHPSITVFSAFTKKRRLALLEKNTPCLPAAQASPIIPRSQLEAIAWLLLHSISRGIYAYLISFCIRFLSETMLQRFILSQDKETSLIHIYTLEVLLPFGARLPDQVLVLCDGTAFSESCYHLFRQTISFRHS